MTPPCIDCCQRHIGCHDICDNYKDYRIDREVRSEEITRDRLVDDYVSDILRKIGRVGRRA